MRPWIFPIVLAVLLVGCAAKAPPAPIPAPGPGASALTPAPTMPSVTLNDIALATQQAGFAIENESSTGGTLYRSDDGGRHWNELLHDGRGPFTQVQFQDAQHGFVKGWVHSGPEMAPALYVTRDGGQQWTDMNPTLPPGIWGIWNGATTFPTPAVGYSVDRFGIEGGVGDPAQRLLQVVILATADGGHTWEDHPLPDGYRATGGISFVDAQHGLITALGPTGYSILRTADGGVHWQVAYTTEGKPVGAPLYDIQMISATDGVAAGGWWIKSGLSPLQLVLATHDGGATWSPIYRGDDREAAAIVRIQFADGKTGWAETGIATLGANGTMHGKLLMTQDGGHTWQKLPVKAQNLTAMGQSVWVVDVFDPMGLDRLDKPVLHRTQDNGSSWQDIELNLPLAGK